MNSMHFRPFFTFGYVPSIYTCVTKCYEYNSEKQGLFSYLKGFWGCDCFLTFFSVHIVRNSKAALKKDLGRRDPATLSNAQFVTTTREKS